MSQFLRLFMPAYGDHQLLLLGTPVIHRAEVTGTKTNEAADIILHNHSSDFPILSRKLT